MCRTCNELVTHPTLALTLTCTLSLLSAVPGFAQAPPAPPPPTAAAEPTYPSVRIGMVSFLQYAAELENRDGFNTFDMTRGYININGQLSRNVRFRFTPDIRRITDGSLAGSLVLRVKYGFLQVDNLATQGSWLRFGLHQTPWLDFEERINRYRVQGTVFSEREGLIPGSGDFGVGYLTPLPSGFGEVQAGIYNGEGFTQTDLNKYKSVQVRLTVRPFPKRGLADGLRISAFGTAGWYAEGQPRHLGIIMGSYEHKYLVVTVQQVAALERPLATFADDLNREGTSMFIEARQGLEGWAGLVRAETFDPDHAQPDNSRRRIIGGVAYWFDWTGVHLGVLLNHESVDYDTGANRPNESRLLLQTHIEF